MDGITDSMGMSLSKLQEMVKYSEEWCAEVCGVTRSQTGLSDWEATTMYHAARLDLCSYINICVKISNNLKNLDISK